MRASADELLAWEALTVTLAVRIDNRISIRLTNTVLMYHIFHRDVCDGWIDACTHLSSKCLHYMEKNYAPSIYFR
jgi:hypothetical protein